MKTFHLPKYSSDPYDYWKPNWSSTVSRPVKSDMAFIKLEIGQCTEVAKFAAKLWSGYNILASLQQSPIPDSARKPSAKLQNSWMREGFDCQNANIGKLYVPESADTNLLKVLDSHLKKCNQASSILNFPGNDYYNRLSKPHWVHRPNSSVMDVQRIELDIWGHPCAVGIMKNYGGWPVEHFCASPTLNCKGMFWGDSGSGGFRFDEETGKDILFAVQSAGIDNATNLFATLDRMVNFHSWLRLAKKGDDYPGGTCTLMDDLSTVCEEE